MARQVVKDIIDQFRARFRGEVEAVVPLALRQEAPDVVFSALLEDDRRPEPEGGPLFEGAGLLEPPPPLPGGGGADMTLDELLGAPQAPTAAPMADPLAAMMDPMAQAEAPVLPPEF